MTAFGRIEQPRYLTGMVAGSMTKSHIIGYVAAHPIPEVVRGINATGVAVVLVEQSLNIASELCTRAVFMEKGLVRFEGRPSELLERDDLARAVFLGGSGEGTK